MQGILYKRRDVFRKRWRPRWFVLDPETCVLTYFLLIHSNGSSSNITDSSRSVLTEGNDDEDNEHVEDEEEDLVPQEQQEDTNHEENEPEEEDNDDNDDEDNNDATTATSMEFSTSHINDQFFHYGEVARGSLDLRKGHYRIEKRDHLNRRNLFVWSVQPTSSGAGYYLATTTAEERDQWMQQLRDCCYRARNGNHGVHDVPSSDATNPAENNASEPIASTPPPEPATAPTHTWQTICKEHLYEDVPNDLQAKIESVVHDYLGFCCGGNDGVAWQPINVRRASPTSPAVQAFLGKAHLEGNQEISLIKCATVLNHSPSQMLGVLMDPMHRQAYEQNLRLAERWKRYNGHTSLDYYAYKPVWPTSPRDFVVAVQWRLLESSLTTTTTTTRPDWEKAICICAVSYDDGDHRRFRNHVRGALHVNLTLLRPVDGMPSQCEFVRVLSYSLGGSVPASLSSSVMQKQAGLPAILASYMAQPSLCLPAVVDLTREALLPIVREEQQLRFNPVASEIGNDNDEEDDEDDDDDDDEDTKRMDLVETSLVLLLPLVLWRAMGTSWLDPTIRGALFMLAVLASVRFVVLQRLGPSTATPLHIGPITCRFSVNLRRVLRTLADQQNQETDVKVSVVHLVVKAAATALEEMETMNRKVVSYPLLGIHNRSFSRMHVDVSILNATTTDPSARFVTVRGASSLTGSEIAASAARAEQSLLLLSESPSMMESLSNWIQQTLGLTSVKEREGNDYGSCLVVASPESDNTSTAQMDLAIVPTSGAFNVVVVVGGVRLQRPTPPPTPTRVSRRSRPTLQPTLDVSISSNSAACGIGETRKFAERLHQLLDQYSEKEF